MFRLVPPQQRRKPKRDKAAESQKNITDNTSSQQVDQQTTEADVTAEQQEKLEPESESEPEDWEDVGLFFVFVFLFPQLQFSVRVTSVYLLAVCLCDVPVY